MTPHRLARLGFTLDDVADLLDAAPAAPPPSQRRRPLVECASTPDCPLSFADLADPVVAKHT